MSPNIPYLQGMAAVAENYDAFILDLWGVIHDGVTLYPGVVDCLEQIRALDKTWLMLSNAPRRADATRRSMIKLGMPEELCPMVMSSGEAAWLDIKAWDGEFYEGLGRRCCHIGPDRDTNMQDGLDIERVSDVNDADFILNTGPWLDEETVADYEERLQIGARRNLPMICANPSAARCGISASPMRRSTIIASRCSAVFRVNGFSRSAIRCGPTLPVRPGPESIRCWRSAAFMPMSSARRGDMPRIRQNFPRPARRRVIVPLPRSPHSSGCRPGDSGAVVRRYFKPSGAAGSAWPAVSIRLSPPGRIAGAFDYMSRGLPGRVSARPG